MHLLLFVYDHRPEKEPFPLFFAFANERFFEERLLLFPNTMMPTQKKARNLAPKRSSCVSSFFVRKENDDAFFLSIGKMRHIISFERYHHHEGRRHDGRNTNANEASSRKRSSSSSSFLEKTTTPRRPKKRRFFCVKEEDDTNTHTISNGGTTPFKRRRR